MRCEFRCAGANIEELSRVHFTLAAAYGVWFYRANADAGMFACNGKLCSPTNTIEGPNRPENMWPKKQSWYSAPLLSAAPRKNELTVFVYIMP